MKSLKLTFGIAGLLLAFSVLPGCNDTAETAQSDTDAATNSEGQDASEGMADADSNSEKSSEMAGSSSEGGTSKDDNSGAADAESDEPAWVDNNDTKYLTLKSQVGRATEAYIQVRAMTDETNAVDLANLAGASQQVAVALMQQDKEDEALGFLFQSGDLMRAADKIGDEQLVDQYFMQAYYLEGVGRALNGEFEKALGAFDDAVQKGFNQFATLEGDPELADLRSSDGFDKRLAEWKKIALEREEKELEAELAKGKLFDFELARKDIDGNDVDLASLKGKVTIVDIWGTWCPPCRAEIPSFVKLQKEYGEEGFQMVGVNFERGPSEEANIAGIRDMIASMEINYPCTLGDDSVLEQVPNFEGYPTTLFIDKAGNVRMKAVGLHSYEYLELVVKKLLEEEV